MKLKTKRLLAAALAISLTANISLAAFAVTYDIDVGDVYIEGNDEGTKSWQDNNEDYTKDNPSTDDTIIIVQGEDAVEAVKEIDEVANSDDSPYETAEDIADAITDAFDEAGIETSDEASRYDITISGDVSDANIVISDVNMEVDEKGSAAITIEDGSDAEIVLNGDNLITVAETDSSGIQVGTGTSDDDTEATLIIDGTTTITQKKGLVNSTNFKDQEWDLMDAGITVGGGTDDASSSGTGAGTASLTIKGSDDGDDELAIKDMVDGAGILVHDGSSLTIGEADDGDDDLTVNISNMDKSGNTTTGNGIISYGDVTITDGVEVNINDVDTAGINVVGDESTLDISGGAQVKINTDTSASTDEENDDSTAKAGIYISEGANIIIEDNDTSVYIKSTGKRPTYGVVVENRVDENTGEVVYDDPNENAFMVKDNAVLSVSNADTGVSIGKNYVATIMTGGHVEINTGDTGFYLDPGSELRVYGSGDEAESNLTVKNESLVGIVANDADIYISGDKAVVWVYTKKTGIDLEGSEKNILDVTASGRLNVVNDAYFGIAVNGDTGGESIDGNKTILITDKAEVIVSGNGSNSVILKGGNNSLIVDNATLIADRRLSLYGSEGHTSTITINNGSRVEASVIRDYFAGTSGAGSLIVNGGTLRLTKEEEADDLDMNDAETLQYSGVWPVSGDFNGGEKLTNFRLNADELLAFQEANKGEMTDEQFLEAYGYVITTGDGSITAKDEDDTPLGENQLVFQTYGADESGNYIDYNDNGATNLTYTEWYVVDLEKYRNEDGELDIDDLWVWTPAVVLSYYILDEGKTLDDAVPYDESTPWKPEGDRNDILPFVEEDVDGDGVVEYYQVDVNGNKVTVTDEEGNEQYVMVKLDDANATYVLYKDGKFYQVQINSDTGEYTIGKEVNTGIATKATSDHDVIIRGMFLDFGNFKTNEKYETYKATSDNAKTTAFADAQKAYPGYTFWVYNPFDDENVIDLDTIRVTEGDDGQYYQVDEDGNVLSAITLDAENSYVLYVDGKYFKVDSIDGDGNIVLATDENGNRIEMVNGEWVEITPERRFRSKSQVTDKTEENYKNGFALKDPKKPTPDEEEPDPTPQEPTTEEPDEPREPVDHEHPHPEIPVDPVVPVTPETPAQPSETPAETPADPEAPAETPETPASSTPKTGDDSNVAIYLVMAALSGAALIGLGVTGKKKNEEV